MADGLFPDVGLAADEEADEADEAEEAEEAEVTKVLVIVNVAVVVSMIQIFGGCCRKQNNRVLLGPGSTVYPFF